MANPKHFTQFDVDAGLNEDWAVAGRMAVFVFMSLDGYLRQNPNSGVIPPSAARPFQTALRVGAWQLTVDEVNEGLDGLERAGMIERLEDGSIYLPKWQERGHQPRRQTDAERQAKSRSAKAERAESEPCHTSHAVSHDVTRCHATSHGVTHVTTEEDGDVEVQREPEPDHTHARSHLNTTDPRTSSQSPDVMASERASGLSWSGSGSRSTANLVGALAVAKAPCDENRHPPDRSGVPRNRKPHRAAQDFGGRRATG